MAIEEVAARIESTGLGYLECHGKGFMHAAIIQIHSYYKQ